MTKHLYLILFAAASAFAGPPLICHPDSIGNAKSLPWITNSQKWDGADPNYDLNRLTDDTLALLVPSMPLNVRMETIRRAAIYSVKQEALPDHITAQLLARAAAAPNDPMASFDAGYWVEALRQMAFIRRYLRSDSERSAFRWQGDLGHLDGKPLIDHAASLGAKGLQVPLARVEEYRREDLKRLAATN